MTLQFPIKSYDAIVVGARCAGSATALQLARAGLKVRLIEREPKPQDTLSTHALMRPAVALLRNWGLLDAVAAEAPAIRQTQFYYGDERIVIPTKPAPGIEALYAPRRWCLDRILRDAAVAAGAELSLGVTCRELLIGPEGRVTGVVASSAEGRSETIRADIVIGADGRMSNVAKLVQAPVQRHSQHKTAVVYTYLDGIPNEGYRWYYSEQAYAGLIPTNNGQHCFFAGCGAAGFKSLMPNQSFEDAMDVLARWDPVTAEKQKAARPVERLRRFLGAPGHIRQCYGPGWALVGDAGHFKDPATAHGISDAFLDAQRLSDAIVCGDLANYAAARDDKAFCFFDATQQKAAFTHSMEDLKALHATVNTCMKAEVAEVDTLYFKEKTAA